MVSTEVMKNCSSTSLKEVKRTTSSSQLPLKKKADEKFVPLDFVSVEQMTSRKADRASFEFEPLWAGGNKSEPWWRMVDKDDLALLVAQKSLENVENCDLPQPNQRVFVTSDPFASNENMNSDRIFEPLFNAKLNASIRGANEYSDIATTDRTFDSRDLPSCERGYMPRDSENRHSCKHGYGEEEPESNQPSDNKPTRDQLFEALRHSQTRARKAEIAAQKSLQGEGTYRQDIIQADFTTICIQAVDANVAGRELLPEAQDHKPHIEPYPRNSDAIKGDAIRHKQEFKEEKEQM